MIFRRELFTDALWLEVMPLLQEHWEQVAHFKDIPLCPDYFMYRQAAQTGRYLIFTVRDNATLVGYCSYFIGPNPHYTTSKQAVMDVLFLTAAHRGKMVGYRFIKWCDKQLQQFGIQVVYHHIKKAPGLNVGPMLERMGYQAVETIYTRRLDHGSDDCDSGISGEHRQRGLHHDAGREGRGPAHDSAASGSGTGERVTS